MRRNLCYAQSGGVTAVINATAAGVFAAARRAPQVGKILAARNGVLGVLHEEILEAWRESPAELRALTHTPGGAFGSCRVKIPALDDPKGEAVYRRVFDVFRAHNIGYFVYNGGNDSADTTFKLAATARRMGEPVECVGAPKTIDNDLAATDNCPGFGSAAKYVAVSVSEAALDVESMHRTSTKVFILEVMGRNAGWLAAAAGLPERLNAGAGMILFPEIAFDRARFAAAVAARVRRNGYAVITASEGLRDGGGGFLSAAESADAFAHRQLGGVAPRLAAMIGEDLNLKCHWGLRIICSGRRGMSRRGRMCVRRSRWGRRRRSWRLADEGGRWRFWSGLRTRRIGGGLARRTCRARRTGKRKCRAASSPARGMESRRSAAVICRR